jgi:hypothetical protein
MTAQMQDRCGGSGGGGGDAGDAGDAGAGGYAGGPAVTPAHPASAATGAPVAPAANPWAGEVALVIDGQPRVMRLTLGALVELEAALGADSLVALVARFETGRFRTADVVRLLMAGLHGGGWRVGADVLLSARIGGGPGAAARAAADLLARAFALPDPGGRDG